MSNSNIVSGTRITRIALQAFVLSTLLTLAVPAQTKTEANGTDVRPLTVGQPIERELKGGEVHSYSLSLQAGQFLNVVIEQKGIDVDVTFFDSVGKELVRLDGPNGANGVEPLSWVIQSSGYYRLDVRSLVKNAPAGRYEAKIVALRTATEKDENLAAAHKAFREATILHQQGKVDTLRTALKKYEEALSLYRAGEGRQDEANSLGLIGRVHYLLGDNQQALKFYREALTLRRAIGDKHGEGSTLNNIGRVYNVLGDTQQALNFFSDALSLRRIIGDKEGEVPTLNELGGVSFRLGDYQQALKYFNNALALSRSINDKQGEGTATNNIGLVYTRLGDNQGALKSYTEALAVSRSLSDKKAEGTQLHNIGAVYTRIGDYQLALRFLTEALALRRITGDKSGEAFTLSSTGAIYFELREYQQALRFYRDGLDVARFVGDRRGEALTLQNIGRAYAALDNPLEAIRFLGEALPLIRAVGDKREEANTFSNIGLVYSSNPRFRAFLDKQAVNTYQIMRSNAKGLDKNLQQSFLKSIEGSYRRLAYTLIKTDRFAEAQQVLDAFKDQQVFDFDQITQLPRLVSTVREKEAVDSLDQKLGNVITTLRAVDDLKRSIGKRLPTSDETAQLKFLSDRQSSANGDYLAFLKAAEQEFASPPIENDKIYEVPDLVEMQAALREMSAVTKQETVTVYTLVAEDFHALIITPDGIKAVSSPVKGEKLNSQAKQFWALLQTPNFDPTKLGKQLYDTIFKPIEKELPEGTKTILWSLDGNLRYVPMAALYDGKQYLVERYNHVTFTRADKERMTRGVTPGWTATAFGSSKEQTVELLGDRINFSSLPGVGEELSILFRHKEKKKSGIFDGEAFQDAKFTQAGMLEALKLKRPVVHIASHFSFRPGDESRSFLLMGDGTAFTLADMKKHTDMFAGVELLTLSACNTAAQQPDANGRDVDAFFELAQRLGANSVMATLWSVADNSTPWLMREFYQTKLDKKLSKAEALRRAQLSLLKGKAEVSPLATRTNSSTVKIEFTETADDAKKSAEPTRSEIIRVKKQDAPLYDKTKHPPFAHPFYWSPFVLFGNWK